MKTTTLELTPEALAAFVNLVDLGVKAGGLQMVKPAALVLALLEAAQRALNEQGNGHDQFLKDGGHKGADIREGVSEGDN